MATDERWRKLNEIWRAALETEPAQRNKFVREACAGDPGLAAEIHALLAHDQNSGDFLEPPDPSRELTLTGATIHHYAVLEKIGAGGMGVVFRARDTRLNRTVALKLLPRPHLADPDRRRRFAREARAASALNHPNIVTVHDIVEDNGHDALVMEYVAGRPLGQSIPAGGLPLNEALDYAIQIAAGLAAAHAAGIVHRDIKPGNILVTTDGRVKIVDFGLAKLSLPSGEGDESTEFGRIAGTVAYMSPEQAHGLPVDTRSDIFSFGALLYEMVSGRQPFRRDSTAATLAAVIEAAPLPLDCAKSKVPPDLEKLISRCLQKDPARRWQNTGDLLVALREIREERHSVSRARPAPSRWLWVVACALPLLAAGTWLISRRPAPPASKPKLSKITTYPGWALGPSLSPDGNQATFTWGGEDGKNNDIYVKLVGEPNALRLTTDPKSDYRPAWSPDGKRIAFTRWNDGGNVSVLTISPLGGAERKLFDAPLLGTMQWMPDSRWLVAGLTGKNEPNGIFLFPVDGGDPRRLTSTEAPSFDWGPSVTPDGRRLAFARCRIRFSCDVFVQELDGAYSPQGPPRQVTRQGMSMQAVTWVGDSIVYNGSLAWGMAHHLWQVKSDGDSPPERIEYAGTNSLFPMYCPVANRLIFARNYWNEDIWRYQIGSAATVPIIASSVDDANPHYSPDGKQFVFASSRAGEISTIWIANADGSNPFQVTDSIPRSAGSPRWSPDGRSIAFDSLELDGTQNIYVVEATGGQPRPITNHPSSNGLPSWSHDGKWIYFFSDRTGNREIWRAPSAGGTAQRLTTAGGNTASESVDGKTLYYTKDVPGPMFARPLDGGPERKLDIFVGVVRDFTVFEDGIYYAGPRRSGRTPIQFYSFATGKSQVLLEPDGNLFYGLSVSPDRKSILFAKTVAFGADLMIVDNFR